jgi:HAMP domain-containing protein
VDVKRSDEIGDLAQSFQRMITSLRIMRMYPDDKKEDK